MDTNEQASFCMEDDDDEEEMKVASSQEMTEANNNFYDMPSTNEYAHMEVDQDFTEGTNNHVVAFE